MNTLICKLNACMARSIIELAIFTGNVVKDLSFFVSCEYCSLVPMNLRSCKMGFVLPFVVVGSVKVFFDGESSY